MSSANGVRINKATAHSRPDSDVLKQVRLHQMPWCAEIPQCVILVIRLITGYTLEVGG